jgi:outer membrane receptor protein involved in Fe transport
MTQGQLFDLDRVEVLRGPQGTLYGRNTTAGAVNFLTANPTDVFTAGLTAEYSSLGEFKSEGYVSAPASDRFRIRISGATDQGGAWQTNRAWKMIIANQQMAYAA